MELKAYSKNDLLQKLAQSGFFVDYLTLDSFLEKYKIEAIFEDEHGNEFFDVSSFNILVKNVLNKNPDIKQNEANDLNKVDTENINIQVKDTNSSGLSEIKSPVESEPDPCITSQQNNAKTKESLLENIKWYRWDDISSDISHSQNDDEAIIVDKNVSAPNNSDLKESESSIPVVSYKEPQKTSDLDNNAASNVDGVVTQAPNVDVNNLDSPLEKPSGGVDEHTINEINKIVSSADYNEDDFDDIGLISESLQAQEKFQKYIADEIAKKNLSLLEPKHENAFKFDVSEKTLNMIARTVAKKIAKQVSSILLGEKNNNAKLLEVQSKYNELELRANLLEEQNKKLKLLLAESNKNLNSYRPTIFGLYRFVRKKSKKRN